MSPKHERRDPDQPDARNPETGYPNLLSTSDRRGNGKRWWLDVLAKGFAGVLTVVLLGLLALVATGRAYTIYGLPPRVDAAEEAIKGLRVEVAKPRPMTSPEVEALADALAARLPQARKGKP